MLKYALNHWYIALWAVSRKLVNKSLDFPASEPLKAGHCCCLDKIKKQLANGTTLTDSELCTWMYERLSLWTNPCVPQNTKHSRPLTPNFIIKRHFWVKIVFTSAPIQGHWAPKVNNSSIGNYNAPALHHFWQNTNNESIAPQLKMSMTRFQLILPVDSHKVTKNLTGHRMHVAGPQI